jgi:deazaflavin-dependent oxidoreductase (nitroreductase family)
MGVRRLYTMRLAPLRPFALLNARVLPAIDRWAARRSGGRRTVTGAVLPTLLLTTMGRRSGRPRVSPLSYVEHDGARAVVGTNFGQAHHPAWTANLLTHPDAEVLLDGVRTPVHARPATDEERSTLWPRFVAMYPGYETYRRRSGRLPRMFVLEPRG